VDTHKQKHREREREGERERERDLTRPFSYCMAKSAAMKNVCSLTSKLRLIFHSRIKHKRKKKKIIERRKKKQRAWG
jgi:hypothetical protein